MSLYTIRGNFKQDIVNKQHNFQPFPVAGKRTLDTYWTLSIFAFFYWILMLYCITGIVLIL